MKIYNFEHQEHSLKYIENNTLPGTALFLDMGLGKTKVTIDYIRNTDSIKRILVFAPLSILPVWEEEVQKWMHSDDYILINSHDYRQKKNQPSLFELIEQPTDKKLFVITNYESSWRKPFYRYVWDLTICDESTRIKSTRAKQSKAIYKIGQRSKKRMILTGTPITKDITDIFGQYRFLNPHIFGFSIIGFRNRYCIMGGYENYQIIGHKNTEELQQKIYSCAIRITKEECVNLPEKIFENRYIEFSTKEAGIYKKMKKDAIVAIENYKGEECISLAQYILTHLIRLQQITSGFLRDEFGDDLPVGDSKIKELNNLIDDILGNTLFKNNNKIIIWARFVYDIKRISRLCKEKGVKYVCLYGETRNKGEVVEQFQNEPEIKIFIGQPQSGSMGITLTAANYCIFYSLDWSLANYLQAQDRCHRIGQDKNVTYIHLLIKKTIDEKILKALSKKIDIAHGIIESWREILSEGGEDKNFDNVKKIQEVKT